MSWRSVIVGSGARLRYGQRRLVVEQAETVTVPLEDISVLILESSEILLTSRLLAECAEAGVAVLTVGADHLPNGVLTPFLSHSRCLKVLERQLAMDRPRKKRAWQRIVRQKILNQAVCLDLCERPDAGLLRRLADSVRSGDPDNVESSAAQRYFSALFGPRFSRRRPSLVNAALNYGYAVLRAALGRSLAAYGFLPVLGIRHCNEQNAFNLADDWLEPYRPLVDLYVARHFADSGAEALSSSGKARLVSLLHHDVPVDGETLSAMAAIEKSAASFGRYLEDGDPASLKLPGLLPLNMRRHE